MLLEHFVGQGMIRDSSSLGMFSSCPPSLSYWRVKSAFGCVSLGLDWVCAGLSFRALEKGFFFKKKSFKGPFCVG